MEVSWEFMGLSSEEGAIKGANLGYEFIPDEMRSDKRSYQEFPNHILEDWKSQIQ